MKYRQKPEYFIVEELANHNIVDDGAYKLYNLTKEGVETFALLIELSKKNKIPYAEIGIAGIKDKHAKTSQYITIPSKYKLDDSRATFLGYVNVPIQLGNLQGNRFKLIVTEITKDELEIMYDQADTISEGILNYFDSQRFGSVSDNEFIAKYVIKKDYESAVKHYVTAYNEFEKSEVKSEKDLILNHWGKFDCKITNPEFKRITEKYKQSGKWILAFKQIKMPMRTLLVSAYQSYIWNECVKELVKDVDDVYEVPYSVGSLTFLNEFTDLPETFSTVSHKMEMSDFEEGIIEKVLEKEGLELSEFNIRQSGNFFKSHKRNVMVVPTDFKISAPQEMAAGFAVSLEFTLPKGSYATLVLKKLFGK